jgi:hypothetical protein
MKQRRDYESNRQKGIAIARQVSAVLRKAGFEKAGPYKSFQKRDPGFVVSERGNGTQPVPTASVMWAGNHYMKNDVPADVIAAIETDGRFDITMQHSTVNVTRRES